MQMNEEVRKANWKPLALTRTGPFLSHVCFADDIMLFGEASEELLRVMMGVLDSFCSASGSKGSLQKPKFFVSKNICHSRAVALSSSCQIPLTLRILANILVRQ